MKQLGTNLRFNLCLFRSPFFPPTRVPLGSVWSPNLWQDIKFSGVPSSCEKPRKKKEIKCTCIKQSNTKKQKEKNKKFFTFELVVMVGSATNRLCQFWQYACVCVWECECAFWNLNGQYVDMSTFTHARLRTHTHTLRIMGGRNLLRPHPLTAKETPPHLQERSTSQEHHCATSTTPASWVGRHLAENKYVTITRI